VSGGAGHWSWSRSVQVGVLVLVACVQIVSFSCFYTYGSSCLFRAAPAASSGAGGRRAQAPALEPGWSEIIVTRVRKRLPLVKEKKFSVHSELVFRF